MEATNWTTIMGAAADALVPVLAMMLTLVSAMAARWIRAKIHNEYFRGAAERLNDAVTTAVREMTQGAAEDLNAAAKDGKLTDDEKASLKEMAIRRVKDYLGPKGLKILMQVAGLGSQKEVDAKIASKVEATIHDEKRRPAW